ncbi:unnamed protein product [Lymnaea stagnalis]|uniref:Uncharacterized protein n=1 Tax=Lymnaea stagnalis TaxID=6523 RepID=A0AAV2I406_LYMST
MSTKGPSSSSSTAHVPDVDGEETNATEPILTLTSDDICSLNNDEPPSNVSEDDIDVKSLNALKHIFTETSTMTDVYPDTKYSAGLVSTECSVAQTMTEFINFESSSTQTEHTIDDDSSESAFQIVEIWPEAVCAQTASVSVQAEMDARKVYQQTERLQQKHQMALKRLQKKFLAIRRRCQKEAQELKQSDRRKNEFLSKLQLSLPNLQKEKSSLMAERASIDKQFEDEKKKNRELVGRLTRLNQQFYRLGQVQQQPPPPPIHWRQQYQHQPYPPPTTRPHCDPTNHLNHPKPGHLQPTHQQANMPHQQLQQKVQQQSTLLQNQVRGNNPVPPPNQPQLQNQQQQLIQQQQLLHQQRLPIFQLFNKSFCPPHHENQQPLQQPQAQQQHSQQHPKMQQP